MKVLITGGGSGGHVSPALAVAEKLRLDFSDIELLYVGGSLTMEGSTGESIEASLVKPTSIPFVTIKAGKLKRGGFSVSTITRLWGVLPGMWQAWRVVKAFKPAVVFSSGGYVSLPVVIAAWLQRVPVVIHEQTASVGLANSLAGKLATKIAITFTQSAEYFDKTKVVLTGNPIAAAVIQPDMDKLESTGFGRWLRGHGDPIIYITGGGLGSHVMNVAVEEQLKNLLQSYRVVHQSGSHAGFGDYDRLVELVKTLPEPLQKKYWLVKHLSSEDVGLVYSQVSLVVARAGANTVLEIAAWGLPAIFIPIPWVTHDEQTKNAQVLVKIGSATLLPENQLSGQRLLDTIDELILRIPDLTEERSQAKKLVDGHATERLASLVRESAKK